RERLSVSALDTFQPGAQCQMYHALATVAVGILLARFSIDGSAWLGAAGWLFVAGTLLFSGSLYLLALTDVRWLGAITPLGGGAFLLGWLALAIGVWGEAGGWGRGGGGPPEGHVIPDAARGLIAQPHERFGPGQRDSSPLARNDISGGLAQSRTSQRRTEPDPGRRAGPPRPPDPQTGAAAVRQARCRGRPDWRASSSADAQSA